MSTSSGISLFQAMHSAEIEAAALGVLRSGQIASGPKVAEFEQALAGLIGRPDVVCTSDMTTALVLALHLAGVGPGDEVLTLAFSCMSSNSPIVRVGAKAVWVDIEPTSASMSVADVKRALTPRTKAVMLYHVAGYPGPARDIAALCHERGIALIEDCNNALGAQQDGAPVGQHGDYAVYSFYPNRQINAIEGGALVCPDRASAQRAIRLRRFGIDGPRFRDAIGEISPSSDIPEVGWSASFNQLSAAVGLTQIPSLAAHGEKTRSNAERLRTLLAGVDGLDIVNPLQGAHSAYWAFLVLVDNRDTVLARLKQAGIGASKLHHRNDSYSGFQAEARDLPGTDRFMDGVIGLPCGWWLDGDALSTVAAVVRSSMK